MRLTKIVSGVQRSTLRSTVNFLQKGDSRIYQDYLLAASYLFEKDRGIDLDDYAKNEIDSHDLASVEITDVVEKIKLLISSASLTEKEQTTAYFSLGKRIDSSQISYFQDQLKVEVDRNEAAVYQLLICLDNLEEPVFGNDRGGSYSYFDHELNIRDSRQYLLKSM